MRVIPAILLVAIAIWEIVASLAATRSVPDDDAWREAAQVVRFEHRPGDLIVFAPAWNDPVGRLHLGDLIPIKDAARMDAAKYGRIWELAIRGARAPETAAMTLVSEREVAGIAIRRWEQTPAIVLADLRDRVRGAKPEGNKTRGPTLELQEVGFAPRECILVVPAANEAVRITFPQVPLGTELVGYAGLADVFTRRDIRTPGRIAVEIDGLVVADRTLGVEDGWVRFATPTAPGPRDVTVIVAGDAANRQVCFAAEARR